MGCKQTLDRWIKTPQYRLVPIPAGEADRLITPRQIAATLLVCAAPFTVSAKPIGQFAFVVEAPGDQVDPSIDGEYVVYAGPGPAGDGTDVFLHDLLAGTTEIIGGGLGDQDSPDVNRDAAIYRTPEGILIEFWQTDGISRAPPPGGDGQVSNPVVHTRVAAWEHHNGADLDVVVTRYRSGSPPYALRSPGGQALGDQHAPSAFDDFVAFVDDALGGSVWLHDSTAGELDRSQICAGRATGVSLGREGSSYVLAVARASAGADEDIEVYDVAGTLLASLPAAGPQRNPHLAGDWVAFEDYSTAFSQVVLWRWKTPRGERELVFVPRPSATQQRLNDVTLSGTDEVRVVFEDSASVASGRDIGLYRLPIRPIRDDGQPSGWPIGGAAPAAGCQDPNAVVLATLELERAPGKPWQDSVSFTVDPPPGEDELPVLVCIHAERVSAAWVALDGEAVAVPSDFEPHVVDLEISSEVDGGRGRLSGVIDGKPGARLVVRVIANPDREDAACRDDHDDDDGDHDDGDGDHDGDGDGDHDDGGDHDGDGDHDGGGNHGRDDHRRDAHGREKPVCHRGDPQAGDTGGAAASGPVSGGGGCGNTGGLASLGALAALLARRKPRS